MVDKSGTIVLIMKIASKVGPFFSCCCMMSLTSNYFGERLSSKPESLTVGYSRTRTRIYKGRAYCRERASSERIGGPQDLKYPILVGLVKTALTLFLN